MNKAVEGMMIFLVCFLLLDVAFSAPIGKIEFESNCSTCHNIEFYKQTLKRYDGLYVADFVDTISATMPANNPGFLSYEEYIDISKYIMNELGYLKDNEFNVDTIKDILIKQ